MAKRTRKNPLDMPPPPQETTWHPDVDINNADWPKRRPDFDAFTGKLVYPVVPIKNRPKESK